MSSPYPLVGVRVNVPLSVLTDSYKASHYLMYPSAQLMAAYGEFRSSFNGDKADNRLVFCGMRYVIENYVSIKWTERDVDMADLFYRTHNMGSSTYPFPKELFLKFVRENNGYFPVRIESLPEGTVCNVHTPVYQIFAAHEYSRLVTFLETILTHVWYPTTVATLSRRTKDLVEDAFDKTVDDDMKFLIGSRLHDFGFRGCTCVEQSIIGGCAHLLNFEGSDTMSAAYYAQFFLNNGKPVCSSIPATEHSVMTAWPNERLAMENMIDKFGGVGRVFAIVMDSYDYTNALNRVLPSVADAHKKKGGIIVLRPDSGDPVECIVDAMRAGEMTFGTTTNKKGFKVINGMTAIQGDGINYNTVRAILEAVEKEGFAAQNVAFGMGAGLLQKVNRDTMSFATKLSFIIYEDGTSREIMKKPKTDGGKTSLPGVLDVIRDDKGLLHVKPRPMAADRKSDNGNGHRSASALIPPPSALSELKVVYDHGPVNVQWETFDEVRKRIQSQWKQTPKDHNVVGKELKDKIQRWIQQFNDNYNKMFSV